MLYSPASIQVYSNPLDNALIDPLYEAKLNGSARTTQVMENNLDLEMECPNEDEKEWLSRSDVCRCCLTACGALDLTGTHITDNGEIEVLLDMLKECFNINLNVSECGRSRSLCDGCATRLRLARDFKQQVWQAEERFADYHRNKVPQVKVEYENFKNTRQEDSSEEKMQVKSSKAIKRTSTNQYSVRKRTKKRMNNDDDGINVDDAMESEFYEGNNTKCYEMSSNDVPTEDHINSEDSDTPISKMMRFSNKEEIINVKNVPIKAQKVKQISERKRIKLTCETVLQNTTACPFRHHKSWFQCFYCTIDFMTIDKLRQHTKNHKPEEITIKRYPRSLQIDITEFQCKICDVSLTDVKNMIEHFSVVHNKVVYQECIADYKVNTSPYTCHLCLKQYHVFRTLTTHLNEHYANYICHVCGKSFLNSKRLKVHRRTHEIGVFPCQKCGKVLKTKTSKANHMETHSKRIIKCHLCLKPMKHYNDRIKHMSEEHNVTHKFKCHICDREYNIKHYLATHMRQTHGHKNKKCLECGMAFITNHGLKKHMLKHTGVKAFACNVCSKSYARSYTLKEHMRGHDEAKIV